MKLSKFNLSHYHSTTADAGQLIPFLLQPTLPGDRFRIGLKNFIRCQPMVAPLMHEVYLYTQYWYVPYRILWDNWEDFITGGESLSASPSFPQVTAPSGGWKTGSLADYFGFPVKQSGIKVSAMPFRAYAEIWNTRYRDQDLQSDVPVSYNDGSDDITNMDILSPSWKRDYFTLARPWTQRGGDILVPVLGGDVSRDNSVYHKHDVSLFLPFMLHWSKLFPGVAAWNPNAKKLTKANVKTDFPYDDYYSEMLKTASITLETSFPGDEHCEPIPPGTYRFTDVDNTYFWMLAVCFLHSADAVTFSQNFINNMMLSVSDSMNSNSTSFSNRFVASEEFSVLVQSIRLMTVKVNSWPFIYTNVLKNDTPVQKLGTNPVLTSDIFGYSVIWKDQNQGQRGLLINILSEKGTISSNKTKLELTYYQAFQTSGNFSVRDLRASSALQRYAERSLKYGNRYEEFIQREFGVKPRDSRIQRPEYLGGGRGILNISEVLQTAEGTDTSVGTMRGHGVASISQRPIRFKCPEHGIIIGLLSIRPKAVYTQGIEREFLKKSRLDFFTPELANIGMQEVLTQELFATAGNVNDIFGYSDRYQEYRYHKPLVTGEFRGLLNYWNMARIFDNAPKLNDEFINMEYSKEVFKRPFAVQDASYHSFLIMLENSLVAWRPVSKRSKDILR